MAVGNGKKVSQYKLLAIQADYEAGIATLVQIAAKHHIDRTTLFRNAKKHGWEYGKCNTDATSLIKEKATERIVRDETDKLIDYTTIHHKHIKDLSALSAVNKADLAKIAKGMRSFEKIDKTKVWNMINIQRYIESSVKTYDMIYKSQRLAMGLKDVDTPPVVNINIGKAKELREVSDNDLEILVSELN